MLSRRNLAPYVCALIVLVLNLSFYSQAAPQLRLVELGVCREYYRENDPRVIDPGGNVEEELCKVDDVQRKVAWLLALDEILHFCCDLIAMLPLGYFAERYGPRPVMILNFSGLILSWIWFIVICVFYNTFNINLVLTASLFCLPGGASHAMTALVYSEAALVSSNRTITFSLLEGIIQISQLIGPVIGSGLLMVGVYIPYYFIFPFACTSILLALFLPRASQSSFKKHDSRRRQDVPDLLDSSDEERERLLSQTSYSTEGRRPENLRAERSSAGASVQPHDSTLSRSNLSLLRSESKSFWRLFSRHRLVQYVYAASLVVTLGKQTLHILIQYSSKKLSITIANAGFLFSIKAAVVLVLYTFILPCAQKLRGDKSEAPDIRLTKLSIVILATGAALMGVAWNVAALIPALIVYALGFGFPVFLRGMLSIFASANNLSIPLLFSGVAIAETAGSFIGAYTLTAAFTGTIHSGGLSAGAPFFIASACYAAIAIATFSLNIDVDKFHRTLQ